MSLSPTEAMLADQLAPSDWIKHDLDYDFSNVGAPSEAANLIIRVVRAFRELPLCWEDIDLPPPPEVYDELERRQNVYEPVEDRMDTVRAFYSIVEAAMKKAKESEKQKPVTDNTFKEVVIDVRDTCSNCISYGTLYGFSRRIELSKLVNRFAGCLYIEPQLHFQEFRTTAESTQPVSG